MAKGSVITTHLLDGDPQGIRRVFIKNKTCEMYIIPRTLIQNAKNNRAINLKQPALYILLENLYSYDEKPKAYIGHAEDANTRLDQHITDITKDFFNLALVFVSADHSINKADVQYLEYKAIEAARLAGRFDITSNVQGGTLPHLSPDQEDVIDEFREFVWLLTSFAGCRIFLSPITHSSAKTQNEKVLFHLEWANHKAIALYGQDEIVILKGSELRKETVKSANPLKREKYLLKYRDKYSERNGKLILSEDLTISSPSTAAWLVTGTGLNGWKSWKTTDGKTLDEVYRKDSPN